MSRASRETGKHPTKRAVRHAPSRERHAVRLVLLAGLALNAVQALRSYTSGALTPKAITSGHLPKMELVTLGGGVLLTLFVALSLRAAAIASEKALEREREARDLLSLQSRRFQALEREGWDGVLIVDQLGVIRWIGVTAAKMLQFDPHEVVGESMISLVHFSDVDGFIAALGVEKDDNRTFEFRMNDGRDRERWFEGVMSNHADDDAVSGVVIHMRDTTEWHNVEDALRDRDDRVRAAFDDSPFGSALVDADGLLRSVNEGLAALLDVEASELTGRKIGSLLTPRDRSAVRSTMRAMLTYDEPPLQRDVVLRNGVGALLALTPIRTGPREVGSFLLQIVGREIATLAAEPELVEEMDDELVYEGEIDPDEGSFFAAELQDEDEDDENENEDEDDQDDGVDDEFDDAVASLADIGAPSAGWADRIVDIELTSREESVAAAEAAEVLVAEGLRAEGAYEPSQSVTEQPLSILRAIANAHRADKGPREFDDAEPPRRAMPL
jgi:PAS domain S-box-containing protein